MRSIGARMVVVFLILVTLSITIATSFSLPYLIKLIYNQANFKMESDLEVCSMVFNQKKQSLLLPARVLAKDMWFNKILAGRMGNLVKERVKYFIRGLSESDLTYMAVTDSAGIVLFRSETAYSTGDNLSGDPAVSRALRGEEIMAFRVLGAEELWREGLIAEPPTDTSVEEGLAIIAIVPVFQLTEAADVAEFVPPDWRREEVVGVIIVGYLLNSDSTLLAEIGERTRGRASIYLPGGLVNSSADRGGLKEKLDAGLFDVSSYNSEGTRILNFRDKGEVAGYFPLHDIEGDPLAVFELRSSTLWISMARAVSLRNYVLFILAGIAIAFVVGLLLTRRITEPIHTLRQGAEEIGRGNLLHRIEIPGSDEISQLADAFNDMGIRLHRSMEEMRFSKQQIEDYSQRLKSAHSSLEMYSRELEKVNRELLVSNINLQKANEVKDTFLSTVSHELKTPLTTIIGYVSMILESAFGPLNEDQRQSLEVVLRRGRNLEALISDLLSLSRIDAGKLELHRSYIDLGKELRGIEEVFSERIKEAGLHCELVVEDGLPRVHADRDRINQVIFNLVSNAIKFTPAEGRITVSAKYVKDANEVQVSVADTGIGIEASEIDHIFERFYQVDKHDGREYGGTGLGLAIARELVELHGGGIWVESSPGSGSVFRFSLPLS